MSLTPWWLPQAKDASQVSPELSALVVYCQAVPFPGLAQALRHPQPCQMSSFSERKARKLIKEAGEGHQTGTGMGTGWLHAPDTTGMQDGLRMVGSVSRVAPWVVVTVTWPHPGCPGWVTLGSAGRVWGQRPELGSHHQDQGLGSGFRMWHLGPGLGLGKRSGSESRD